MLERQCDCFLGKLGRLANFPAGICGIAAASAPSPVGRGNRRFSLTRNGVISGIHLESAAFMFHMMPATQGITGSLRAACSEPVVLVRPTVSGLPLPANQNRRPKHAGVSDTLARSWLIPAGRLLFLYGKNHLLTSFQDFGLADPISRALKEENYLTPTPIQAQTIPARACRTRRRRHRPDRHRQDRSFRAADPAPHSGKPHPAAAKDLPRAGALARPANCRARSSTASTPMAATSASPRRWRSAACRWAARSAR